MPQVGSDECCLAAYCGGADRPGRRITIEAVVIGLVELLGGLRRLTAGRGLTVCLGLTATDEAASW